jgi:hypothetical protein
MTLSSKLRVGDDLGSIASLSRLEWIPWYLPLLFLKSSFFEPLDLKVSWGG